MTPPEDKAPDMPSDDLKAIEIEVKYALYACQLPSDAQESLKNALSILDRINTLPPQSPDQGAVEAAMAALDGYSPDSDEQVSIGIKHLYALTRPNQRVDVAGLRKGDDVPSHEWQRKLGWNACLDHLQAIRPDLFGGKKI